MKKVFTNISVDQIDSSLCHHDIIEREIDLDEDLWRCIFCKKIIIKRIETLKWLGTKKVGFSAGKADSARVKD